MKLRALELEQFRKFDRKVRLAGFSDRINVLCGPNEYGKSTILAAIRGLMFERHNSGGEQIKRMQNRRGNAAPHLAMEFDIGGGVWRIEKRFLSKPMAQLTGPDGSRFDNVAAEEELQRLLGFGASGNKGARIEQMGVWGALWVTQRNSVDQADLTHDIARATITSCLDAEVGVMTGTETGQALLRAVREARGEMIDGNGRPRGRYKEVLAALESTDNKLAALRGRSQKLTEDAGALRSSHEKLARESDPAAEQHDRAALKQARDLREAAMVHAERLAGANNARNLALRNLEDARREQTARQKRASHLAASEAAWRTELANSNAAQAADAEAEAIYAAARQEAGAAQQRATAAALAARRGRTLADLVRRAASLSVWQARLEKAEAEQKRLGQIKAQLETMPVTQARIDAVRKAVRECEAAEATLSAQATQLAIDLQPDEAGRVTIAGEAVPEARFLRAVTKETEIAIAGIGVIRVTPAMQGRETIDKRIAQARGALSVALTAIGCADAAAAETSSAARETLLREQADSQAALERLAPGDAAEKLAPGIAALRDHVSQLQNRVAAESATLGLATLPTPDDALAQSSAADAADAAAADALAQARAAADTAGDQRNTARDAAAQCTARAHAAETERARLALETSQAEAQESTTALAARLRECQDAHEHRAAEAAALDRARPEHSADAMAARIERYEAAIAQRVQTVRNLRETITELRTRITQEGGNGLDEQIATEERNAATLHQERDAFTREVKILTLLLETLLSAEKETKERYLAPVIRRVTPYLNTLFPGADVQCDDDLRVTGLTRSATGQEDFERLSDGTQEQIAVLSRLAFAEMLIDQGKPAMVILDDALAYSDADRMERMFDILTQASAKTQILVLTCREDLFSRLGGNRLELTQLQAADA